MWIKFPFTKNHICICFFNKAVKTIPNSIWQILVLLKVLCVCYLRVWWQLSTAMWLKSTESFPILLLGLGRLDSSKDSGGSLLPWPSGPSGGSRLSGHVVVHSCLHVSLQMTDSSLRVRTPGIGFRDHLKSPVVLTQICDKCQRKNPVSPRGSILRILGLLLSYCRLQIQLDCPEQM